MPDWINDYLVGIIVKRKLINALFGIFISIFLAEQVFCSSGTIPLVPSPRNISYLNGNYILKQPVLIYVNEECAEIGNPAVKGVQRLSESCSDIKFSFTSNPQFASITLNLLKEPDSHSTGLNDKQKSEYYTLSIEKSGIQVKALNSRGFFYGLVSLLQLFEFYKDTLPAISITDYPALGMRAISDDISRGQVSTLDNFKRIIDHLAYYKINTYMPYLEDMVLFEQFPSIGKNRGALSEHEIRELVSYASERFVEIIPIFQTLGHYENILAMPEFVHLAEFPGAASLCITNDSIYPFLESMLGKLFDWFPSPYFHIGADESFDVGYGKSKNVADSLGIGKLHALHYKKIYDICKRHGKTVMMYGDIILRHPEILNHIPKDIIVVDWHYRPDFEYKSPEIFHNAGFRFLVSPSVWNFTSSFPVVYNSVPNVQHSLESGIRFGALGMVNSNWGDFGAETFKELVLQSYSWSAACAWNPENSDYTVFSKNFTRLFFGISSSSLTDAYNVLGHPVNHYYWNEAWRHPLLPFRDTPWWEPKVSASAKISWLRSSLANLRESLNELSKHATNNKDHILLLEFMCRFNLFLSKKQESVFYLNRLKESSLNDNLKHEYFTKAKNLVNQLINEIPLFRDEYKTHWLKYYKPENLSRIEDKFNRLLSYFKETDSLLSNLQNGKLPALPSPAISSEWLYTATPDSIPVANAVFTYNVHLENLPIDSEIQLISDGHTTLFVNNVYAGEVYVRRSLSLVTEYERVKIFNITNLLVEGQNTIQLFNKNYSPNSASGININGYVNFPDGKTTRIKTEINGDWKAADDKGNRLIFSSKKFPFEIIEPDFQRRRYSWIER